MAQQRLDDADRVLVARGVVQWRKALAVDDVGIGALLQQLRRDRLRGPWRSR